MLHPPVFEVRVRLLQAAPPAWESQRVNDEQKLWPQSVIIEPDLWSLQGDVRGDGAEETLTEWLEVTTVPWLIWSPAPPLWLRSLSHEVHAAFSCNDSLMSLKQCIWMVLSYFCYCWSKGHLYPVQPRDLLFVSKSSSIFSFSFLF